MTNHFQSSGVNWHIKRLTTHFLNFVFPPVCANCKKTGALMCADCLASLSWTTDPICAHCGRVANRPVSRCPACLAHPLFPMQQVRAAVLFTEPIPTIIHNMKYNGMFALAEPLAALMVDAWPKWAMPVDLVVGVPLHRDREKLRGYNQSDLLAHHFCTRLNLNDDCQALQRVRNTPPQVGLKAVDRQQNMLDAFKAAPDKVAGKDILLVDDVCTTGSTLKSAAQALLLAGARRVSGYCLARAI